LEERVIELLDLVGEYWVKYSDWGFWMEHLPGVLQKATAILFILIFTWVIIKIRKVVIQRIFHITRLDEKQEKTLESLLMSLTKYIVFIIAFLMILSNVGLNIGPIIAGAGVIGLAIGFGAQTLVKDLITGFFIIFEDQFSVGDYVSVNNGEINGTVVEVGLRATKIRTWAQHVVVIQNSEIRVSQNYNRDRMRAIVNVTVSYEVDPKEIELAVHAISTELVENYKHFFLLDDKGEIIEPPTLYGITDVENNALGAKYTVICLVKDIHYWTAGSEIRRRLIEKFRDKHIQISYPRRVERLERLETDLQ
jgi:small-conductance mechanosensitive channel